jgi:hypothetical protein
VTSRCSFCTTTDDDAALLGHPPRIEAVRDQVDDDLRAWVAAARRRELS